MTKGNKKKKRNRTRLRLLRKTMKKNLSIHKNEEKSLHIGYSKCIVVDEENGGQREKISRHSLSLSLSIATLIYIMWTRTHVEEETLWQQKRKRKKKFQARNTCAKHGKKYTHRQVGLIQRSVYRPFFIQESTSKPYDRIDTCVNILFSTLTWLDMIDRKIKRNCSRKFSRLCNSSYLFQIR